MARAYTWPGRKHVSGAFPLAALSIVKDRAESQNWCRNTVISCFPPTRQRQGGECVICDGGDAVRCMSRDLSNREHTPMGSRGELSRGIAYTGAGRVSEPKKQNKTNKT